MNFLSLPDELLIELLSVWLPWRSVVQADCAICSKMGRQLFLQVFQKSPITVSSEFAFTKETMECIEAKKMWLASVEMNDSKVDRGGSLLRLPSETNRRGKLFELAASFHSLKHHQDGRSETEGATTAVIHLARQNLKSVELAGRFLMYGDPALFCISNCCPNLTTLCLDSIKFASDKNIGAILEKCLKLSCLTLRNLPHERVTDYTLHIMQKFCTKLCTLSIVDCQGITCLDSLNFCKSKLVQVDIGNLFTIKNLNTMSKTVSDFTSTFGTTLTSLGLERVATDHILISIGATCKSLVSLDISNHHETALTIVGVEACFAGCKNLTTFLTLGCRLCPVHLSALIHKLLSQLKCVKSSFFPKIVTDSSHLNNCIFLCGLMQSVSSVSQLTFGSSMVERVSLNESMEVHCTPLKARTIFVEPKAGRNLFMTLQNSDCASKLLDMWSLAIIGRLGVEDFKTLSSIGNERAMFADLVSRFSKLTVLHLELSKITDAQISQIALRNPLEHVTLQECDFVTNVGLGKIADACFETLTEVKLVLMSSINGNGISFMLSRCAKLFNLTIDGCLEVTEDARYHGRFRHGKNSSRQSRRIELDSVVVGWS